MTNQADYSYLWEEPELAFANEMRWLPFWSQTGAPDTGQGVMDAMQGPLGPMADMPELWRNYFAPGLEPSAVSSGIRSARREVGRGPVQTQLSGFGYQPPQSGRGTNIQDFYRNRFSDIFSQYQGQLGAQTEAHQTPSLGFRDYLQSYPFLQQFYNQAPAARGELNRRFAPPTQFMPSF